MQRTRQGSCLECGYQNYLSMLLKVGTGKLHVISSNYTTSSHHFNAIRHRSGKCSLSHPSLPCSSCSSPRDLSCNGRSIGIFAADHQTQLLAVLAESPIRGTMARTFSAPRRCAAGTRACWGAVTYQGRGKPNRATSYCIVPFSIASDEARCPTNQISFKIDSRTISEYSLFVRTGPFKPELRWLVLQFWPCLAQNVQVPAPPPSRRALLVSPRILPPTLHANSHGHTWAAQLFPVKPSPTVLL